MNAHSILAYASISKLMNSERTVTSDTGKKRDGSFLGGL